MRLKYFIRELMGTKGDRSKILLYGAMLRILVVLTRENNASILSPKVVILSPDKADAIVRHIETYGLRVTDLSRDNLQKVTAQLPDYTADSVVRIYHKAIEELVNLATKNPRDLFLNNTEKKILTLLEAYRGQTFSVEDIMKAVRLRPDDYNAVAYIMLRMYELGFVQKTHRDRFFVPAVSLIEELNRRGHWGSTSSTGL